MEADYPKVAGNAPKLEYPRPVNPDEEVPF
jgi:hypothetical protein